MQSGFAEASQLRCGEAFLEKLPGYLGVEYGGTLIKGDNFGIRILKEEDAKKVTGPYREMGKAFVTENGDVHFPSTINPGHEETCVGG